MSEELKNLINKMFEIIPGINETEWKEIEKKIEIALSFAKTIHIDLEDGLFVDRKTFFDPKPFKKYTDKAIFELHMMVNDPLQYLKPWADCGFKRFIGHVEKMPDPVEFVAQGQLLGGVGLALDGPTSINEIEISYEDLDCILVFTAKRVGPSGSPFLDKRLEKIKDIRKKSPYLPIEVDGGINDKSIIKSERSGANRFVSTSYIFNSDNPLESYNNLEQLLFQES